MFLDTYVESPILGTSQILDEEGEGVLNRLIERAPLAVFQALNKKFNQKGLCSSIALLPQEKAEK